MIQVSIAAGRAGTEILTTKQKSKNPINHFNIDARPRDLAKKGSTIELAGADLWSPITLIVALTRDGTFST